MNEKNNILDNICWIMICILVSMQIYIRDVEILDNTNAIIAYILIAIGVIINISILMKKINYKENEKYEFTQFLKNILIMIALLFIFANILIIIGGIIKLFALLQ